MAMALERTTTNINKQNFIDIRWELISLPVPQDMFNFGAGVCLVDIVSDITIEYICREDRHISRNPKKEAEPPIQTRT
jgi:hypothetical protein